MKFLVQHFQKLEFKWDRQTDRDRCDRTHYHAAFTATNNNCLCI